MAAPRLPDAGPNTKEDCAVSENIVTVSAPCCVAKMEKRMATRDAAGGAIVAK